MREVDTKESGGVIRARIGRDVGVGAGKRILKSLPACFYAVDLCDGSVLLHHDSAGEAELACAMEVLAAHGGIL